VGEFPKRRSYSTWRIRRYLVRKTGMQELLKGRQDPRGRSKISEYTPSGYMSSEGSSLDVDIALSSLTVVIATRNQAVEPPSHELRRKEAQREIRAGASA